MNEAERIAPRPVSLDECRMRGTTEILNPETRALHDYWQALRAGRTIPLRNQIDPRAMNCSASSLFIIEMMPDGAQRFRLAGSALTDVVGAELRGLSSRALMEPASREEFAAMVSETLIEPAVCYARVHPAASPQETWELLMLPLEGSSGETDRLIGILVPVAGLPRRTEGTRFVIDAVDVRPIDTPLAEAAGFAEAPAPFAPAPGGSQRPRLTAIEGGGTGGAMPVGRPRLRVITND